MNKKQRLRKIQNLHKFASTSSRNPFDGGFGSDLGQSSGGHFSMPKRKPLAERVPLPRRSVDPLVAAREAAEREARSSQPQEAGIDIEDVDMEDLGEDPAPPMLLEDFPTPTPISRPKPPVVSTKPQQPKPIVYSEIMEWDTPIMPRPTGPRRPIALPPSDPDWMDAPEPISRGPKPPSDPDWMDAPDVPTRVKPKPKKISLEDIDPFDAPDPGNIRRSSRRNRLRKIAALLNN